jgi:hypothetical protein
MEIVAYENRFTECALSREKDKQKSPGSSHPGTEAFLIIYNIPVL